MTHLVTPRVSRSGAAEVQEWRKQRDLRDERADRVERRRLRLSDALSGHHQGGLEGALLRFSCDNLVGATV